MNQWKRLVTAGAGATVALTLVIAPGAVANAEPGHRGSHSGPADRRDDSGSLDGDGFRGDTSSNDSRGTAPSAGTARSSADDPSSESRRPSVTTADGARTVRTARTARTADDAGTGSGLRPTAPVAPSFADAPEPTPAAGAAERALPARSPSAPMVEVIAPQAAAPVPAPITPPDAGLRVADMGLSVLPIGPDPRPGQPMTSLFGILGLLLIPLAGAALGYRQARAARSVGALPRL